MTRKQYQAIAEIIRTSISNPDDKIRTINAFIKLFKAQKPSFNEDRFLQACYSGR